MAQIPLPFVLGTHSRFETFVHGSNSVAVDHLRSLGTEHSGEIVWIWGSSGAGKTHLLQALCAEAAEKRLMYLPLEDALSVGVESLQGLESLDIVVLDDVDALAGDNAWEEALFSLYKQVVSDDVCLVMSSGQSPAGTAFQLPDLASRAAGAVVYQLRPLDDDQSLRALQRHAEARGLDLPDASARYLQTRVSRDMGAICRWLDELDTAALVAKRRLTIPFIGEALAARSGSGS
ncbi:MAG: DnaA regulatory inactivator Hda [Candidatus Rariloculaceae bacterium]